MGHVEEALEEYKRYVSENPSDIHGLINVAECLSTLGHHDEAIKQCKQVLTLDSKHGLSTLAMALAILRKGEEEYDGQAIEYLDKVKDVAQLPTGSAYIKLAEGYRVFGKVHDLLL